MKNIIKVKNTKKQLNDRSDTAGKRFGELKNKLKNTSAHVAQKDKAKNMKGQTGRRERINN